MSIELHMARTVFATIVGRAVQQQCRTACFPALGPVHVDHLDVRPDAIEFTTASAGGVDLRIPMDVFIVTEEALYAAPNAEPATSKIAAVLVVRMNVEGTKTTLRVVDADLDPSPLVGMDAFKAAIIDALSDPLELDLADSLGAVGLLALLGGSSVELTSETVAVRFAPSGQVQPRLHPGQDWGIFLDQISLKAFIGQRIPNLTEVVPQIHSFEPVTHWRPEGDRPRVDVEFQGKADVPDPMSGDFEGVFRVHLSIANTGQQQLRADIDWELHPNLGAWVPGFLDDIAEVFAVAMVDPTEFDAVRTGIRSFRQDTPLPTINFGPQVNGIVTRFEWQSALATADGMTIGGPVRPLGDPGTATLQTTVTPFGRPRGTVFASQHDCSFAGVVPDDLVVLGIVGLDWCGSVCGFDVLAPNTGLEQHVEIDAVAAESQTLRIRLPLDVGKEVTSPVQVLIYTSRGVRFFDLGVPLSQEEAEIGWIDDCLYLDTHLIMQIAYDEWMALYGEFVGVVPGLVPPPLPPDRPNPLDDPDPLADSSGIYTRVIDVDWGPNELVQVRTLGCSIDITTDQQGRASIPVVLAGTDRAQPISLTRVNRGDISSARTRTAIFVRHAAVPRGTVGNTLGVDSAGNALVSADFDDGSDVYELVRSTGVRQVASRSATPEAASKQGAPMEVDLPGLVEIVRVPGFADEPVAIAVMDNGDQLVLNRSADGSTRVAGTFTGNLPRLEVTDEWALGPVNGGLAVFRRSRS